MLVLIAHAIISALYIPSYQHVYAQSQPLALYLGPEGSPIAEMLGGEGYSVTPASTLPPDLAEFNVIVLDVHVGSLDSFEPLENYVEGGGGLVYLSAAAASLDLAANSDWLGAMSVISTGPGENVTVTSDNPVGSDLITSDPLMIQTPDQSGALGVADLDASAQVLAQYTGGAVFAYSFDAGGRVFFQAYADSGFGDSTVEDNLEDLLTAGIVWSTKPEVEPVTDVLPTDTVIDTGHNRPSGSIDIIFSQPGFNVQDIAVPTDPTDSIFVTADEGFTNPILYFEANGQEYRYRVQIDKGTLLTFPSPLILSSARFEADDWSSGVGRVGYVTVKAPPACILPAGATVTDPGSIPPDATAIGSTDFLGSVDIPDPTAPVTSMIVGLDEEVSGYVLSFGAGQFECPIQPEVIEIDFSEPIVISDAAIENDGPWGLIGYIENLGAATIYAKYVTLPQETVLPDGFSIEEGIEAPDQVHSATFALGTPELISVTGPTKNVISLFVSADSDLVDPYLYFTDGDDWHSISIDQSGSSLIHFPLSVEVEQIYAYASAGNSGSIAVGYVYPTAAKAKAGSDQTVQEQQAVYLDGRASAGQGAISFKWTQIEGPGVTLQNPDSSTPSFGAPEVDEQGARLGFRLVVTDSEGVESSDIVVINVKNEKLPNNVPPVIGAIPVASVDEGAHVVLAASAFDADGDTLKYTWTQMSGPEAQLSGARTATLSFNAPVVSADSVLTFEIKVADGLGHATTKEVLVNVIDVAGEVVASEPVFSGGNDQIVLEGSTVFLAGEYGGDTAEDIRWEQTGGVSVTLDRISPLVTSFVAPQTDQESLTLNFRLALYGAEGNIARWDDVAVTVNNTAQVQIVEEEVDPTLEVREPTFSAVERIDAEPPPVIHRLDMPGSGSATAPNPDGPVTGIWINATADMSGLGLHFSSSGRKYSISAESDRPTAYVFDREISIQGINLTAPASIEQIGMGYYYGQIPLVPVPSPVAEPEPELEAIPPIVVTPPEEGAIIKFARENQIIAGLMAIAVPVGIGAGLKAASNHHRKAKTANPARTLFPKNDPVAGEAEKVRPVIEELEKMLGRNLDTAVNASELLDKFGSGRNEATQK